MDSVNNEHIYKEMQIEIYEDYEDGFEYQTFFIKYFKQIMTRLDDIKERTNRFRNTSEYRKLIDDMNKKV